MQKLLNMENNGANIAKLMKKLQNALKISGYNVRMEFCKTFVESFSLIEQNFESYVNKISESFSKFCENNKSIETKHVERVLNDLNGLHNVDEPIFSVIDAFDFPRYEYDVYRQHFVETNDYKPSLLPKLTKSKINVLNERYEYVLQRTKRNFKRLKNIDSFVIETVDYLLTKQKDTSKEDDKVLYFGALFQATPGKYYLEDPTGSVELDLKHAKYHGGFFVDNSFVLIDGHYTSNKVLQVSTMTLPPGETYKESKLTFGIFNYFTNNSKIHLRESINLKRPLQDNQDGYIYFFSNVWLDNPSTLDKLSAILDGLIGNPPIALIFIGNFTSEPQDIRNVENLKTSFTKFATILQERAWLLNTNYVFVPGALDPNVTYTYPKFALPKYTWETLSKLVNVKFTTNPCRIQFCTREIVIFSTNLLQKFMENSLNKPAKEEIPDSVARTVISQGHLAPFSLQTSPVYWDYDYAMRLYPLPNLIVVADQSDSYRSYYKECHFASTSPFTKSGFEFLGYHPYSDALEECKI